MIVFWLKSTEKCMLALNCDIEEIIIENNKAYYNGQVVNNNMAISAIAEVPKQKIVEDDEERTSKLFSELKHYTPDEKWAAIREKRDKLLTNCDWTQIDDSPKKTIQEWLDYRQALRDITIQDDPFNIIWPVKPEE